MGHPNGPQRVLFVHPALFVLLRSATDGSESLLCVHNVSDGAQPLRVDLDALPFPHAGRVRDIIAGAPFPVDGAGRLTLEVAPYQVLWLAGNAE